MDFIVDGLSNGRMTRILSVVDAFTRECLVLEADTSGRVTQKLDHLIELCGQPKRALRQRAGVHTGVHAGLAEERKISLIHIQHTAGQAHAERARRKLPWTSAMKPERELVPHTE